MSITSPDDRITSYEPAVPTTSFGADFPIFDNGDLQVFVDGAERTDFTVSATYAEGVSNDAQVVFSPGISGLVQVVGSRDPRRTNRFTNGLPLPIWQQNLALDTVEAEVQEAAREARRAHRAPIGEEGGIFSAQAVEDAESFAQETKALRDDFFSRYVGAHANDAAATAAAGALLQEGTEYWNSTLGIRRVWHSGAWLDQAVNVRDGDVTFSKLGPDVPTQVLQQYFPGISQDVQGTGLPGADGDSLFFYADITASGDPVNQSVMRVQKHVNYIGGTVGNVKTASWVRVEVENGPTDFHWAGLDHLINRASGGENVARYCKAEKRGAGPTWAACFDIEDWTAATSAALGIEITAKATGADPSLHRNGLNIAIHRLPGAGSPNEWGRGFWTSSLPTQPDNRFRMAFANTAKVAYAVYFNDGDDAGTGEAGALLRDEGALARGIDLSGATYSTSEAMRLAANQRIALEATGGHYIRSTGSLIEARGGRFQATSGLSFPSAGLVSAAATAGGISKPATYGGFLSVLVDGTEKKVPFYNA